MPMLAGLVPRPASLPGPARLPDSQVKADAIKKRKQRDRAKLRKLAAAGIAPPAWLIYPEPGKPGRPRLSDEDLKLPEHAEARKKRTPPASAPEPTALLALLELAGAAQTAQAAEASSARQAAHADRMRRLEHQLGVRNPAADGPRALTQLCAAARVEGDEECGVCYGSMCEGCPARTMRCCGKAISAVCLQRWLACNNAMVPYGYGEEAYYMPVDGESQMGRADGRAISVRVNTHFCPFCRHPVESVGRGLV